MDKIYVWLVVLAVIAGVSCSGGGGTSMPGPTSASAVAPKATAAPDTDDWEKMELDERGIPKLTGHELTVFKDSMYITGGALEKGFNDKVFYTVTGAAWIPAKTDIKIIPGKGHAGAVWKEKLYLSGGMTVKEKKPLYSDKVFSTANGLSWTAKPGGFPGRAGHVMFAYKNSVYIHGGTGEKGILNDVWHMNSYGKWSKKKSKKENPGLTGHSVLVFRGNAYIIGGDNGGQKTNKIYISENGVDWNVLTASAAFKPRSGHSAYVFKERMWITGGQGNDGEYYNDIFWSVNGYDWVTASAKAPFPPRKNHAAGVHVNRVWLAGGENKDMLNDIWAGK